ncbi:MAG: DUF3390 domain-containing protein, partial [Candidatus Thiodiazotropha sp. (ex Lucinoma annulata)]|nr:DUF3390 domain-containing protein [Candidatus Thiodiazotropha sp. (ex Lucinoma annulata)]
GLDKLGDLPTASTLCGACAEVCPVHIPIPNLLNRLRYERTRNDHAGATLGQSSGRTVMEAGTWKGWSWVHSQPRLYRLAMYIITRLRKLLPQRIGPWTQVRKAPHIAPKTLHELALKEGFNDK